MIKPRKGYCKECNDSKEIYLAKRYPPLCKRHNEMRKKAEKKAKGKTGYRYVKKATGEKGLFLSISETREHISELSFEPIHSLSVSNFAHILSKAKGKYPLFKLNPENIAILAAEEHRELDHGLESNLHHLPGWKAFAEKRERLKKEYKLLVESLKIK